MDLREVNSLISAFERCSNDLSEEKVKNLLITPLLTYCYLDAGKNWEDIWDSFYFAKEGEGEVDIKIKVSENSFVLVEVKKRGEDLNLANGGSKVVYPKICSEEIKLEESVRKPSILLLLEDCQGNERLCNLANDLWGQVIRYVLQTFLENQQKRGIDISLILTNGDKWRFLTFDENRLREIYASLRNSDQKIKSENGKYVFNVLNLYSDLSDLSAMEEIKLQELLEEDKLSYFFRKLKSFLSLG